MMKKLYLTLLSILICLTFIACSDKKSKTPMQPVHDNPALVSETVKSESTEEKELLPGSNEARQITKSPNLDVIREKYINQTPKEWSEHVQGVKTKLDTTDKVIALTFDACGGPQSNGYDEELINYLIAENIPASLFINYRWIEANMDTFLKLSKNPLFEIENHGYKHSPLSVNGKTAYGISGTKNIDDAIKEVILNQEKIETITGRKPMFFRPGTAYCDEISVRIVKELGEEVVNYNVLGDAGATFNRNQIKESCLKAVPGSIILFHMNHPEKETFEGIKLVIPELKKRGFTFVKLSQYNLK